MIEKTWRVGVCFCDVRRCQFRWLPLAPDAQLLFCHLGLYSPVVLLKYSTERAVIGGVLLLWRFTQRKRSRAESHLVIVVLKVGPLALQLDHLQPGDPLLLFGCHQVAVRIPALSFPTQARRSYKHATAWTPSSLIQAIHTPTFGMDAVFDRGVVCAGGGAGWRDQGTCRCVQMC